MEAVVRQAKSRRQSENTNPRPDDQKAFGFDWYLGNKLMNQGPMAAQAGNAPSVAGQAMVAQEKPVQPLAPSEPAATPERLVPLEIKLPAPAFKGTPKDLSLLGDVPIVGRLFSTAPGTAASGNELKSGSALTPSIDKNQREASANSAGNAK